MVQTNEELARLDALLVAPPGPWWDKFYADRARPCPFFVTAPDENLAEWVNDGTIRPGRAIDLGCGHARNAIFLARHGFAAEGVDQSKVALDWARDNVAAAGVTVSLTQQSIFDLQLDRGGYDLVYDGGCSTTSRRIAATAMSTSSSTRSSRAAGSR